MGIGIPGGAHFQNRSHAANRLIDGGRLGLAEVVVPGVAHHPHDFEIAEMSVVIDHALKSLAKGFLVGKELPGEGLVDDHCRGQRRCAVLIRKVSPAQEGDLHRCEESRRDRKELRPRTLDSTSGETDGRPDSGRHGSAHQAQTTT